MEPWTLMPAVTSLILRRQTRRQWSYRELEGLLKLFPRLAELVYEPWRDPIFVLDESVDPLTESELQLLADIRTISKVICFKDYPASRREDSRRDRRTIRTTSRSVTAYLSLNLEHMAISSIADASIFFEECKPEWTWERLISLTLTSALLSPDENASEVNDMLRLAGIMATRMPKLETMELWNAEEGLACVFQYRAARAWDCPAKITWRSTWSLQLRDDVIEAWKPVAARKDACRAGLEVRVEEIDGTGIRSHGEAIPHLRLETEVARPVCPEANA
ncbi:hypothetical protein B0T16DRAFT_462567 [Cercophora newfieldiana]|uniref:DUF6546 domain-containing protein n=1 Tax=Cercophora newfieldiana TaxID=92897 RepID=A0AA40CIL1_9PEZI|nr:hypothetical protein B0T16DRAFT_462567 [Cercophora newfieldiana]